MGGGLESCCVGRVYDADGTIHTIHTTYSAALKTTIHSQTRCKKPYAATQHLMVLRWAYTAETCRAKNTSIKLPRCIKLAFHNVYKFEIVRDLRNTWRTFFIFHTSGRWLLGWVQLGRPTSNSKWWIIQVLEKREFLRYDHWTWLITECSSDTDFIAIQNFPPPRAPKHLYDAVICTRFEVPAREVWRFKFSVMLHHV